MTQVSKRFIEKRVEQRILDLFWTSLASLKTKEKVALFLDDLLTPTEKIMLSKRLAIAFMLLKGHNYGEINDVLRVSDATIWSIKIALAHQRSRYKTTIERILSLEKLEKIWDDIAFFIQQAIPPGKGTDWKKIRRKQWATRRASEKPF